MTSHNQFAIAANIAIASYYLFAWILLARGGKLGTIVPSYDPPHQLSPAMLRYIWRRRFDDRTFWAGVLNLVAKGFATLHSASDGARIRATPSGNSADKLANEEQILFRELVRDHTKNEFAINMLNSKTRAAVRGMSESLRREAVGRWFIENRSVVVTGILLSTIALCFAAGPRKPADWAALILALAVTAPGAFYLPFLSMRIWDVLVAVRQKYDWALLRRELLLIAMLLPCVAAIILGGITLGGAFGWPVLATTLFLSVLNSSFLRFVNMPTRDGRQILTEIAGFRLFLESVERLPMERSEGPADHAGLYEKYLPYAVALEVEQAWGDRFVALTSTYHENAGVRGAEDFYLGMWNGKPLEIIYKPEAPKGRSF